MKRLSILLLCAAVLTACEALENSDYSDDLPVLTEVFLTPRDEGDNIDSPAIWHGPNGRHLLLTTAKNSHLIRVSDASTGTFIENVGEEGAELGQFQRPNGIAVIDDLMLVVERDNHRVQLFSLPDFEPLGTFGEVQLKMPYGIYTYAEAPGQYVAYITDDYETPLGDIPPDDELGERVQQFRFSFEEEHLVHEHVRSIGETEGPGVLRVVESIWGDPAHNRLLVADEKSGSSNIKVYTLDGAFTGEVIDQVFFPSEAEGIALYECDDGEGYWITTNQHPHDNMFHLFDRATLEHVGSFQAEIVSNTDGVALSQHAFGPFTQGAFFAVHDDGNTGAFSWLDIAESLQLRADCVAPTVTGH